MTKMVTFEQGTTGSTNSVPATVDCGAGKVVIGGGAEGSTFDSTGVSQGDADLLTSYPSDTTTWAVSMGKKDGSSFANGEEITYKAYAICITAPAA